MHDTAYEYGRLFFQFYMSGPDQTIVELGSQDINGSLRDHCPPGARYIGVDMAPGKSVDLVVPAGEPLPFTTDSIDAAVASSTFEHDICFWETFLELVRILRPGGLLYLNVPSDNAFHRYPVDCWRFYPDAGVALMQWAARKGMQVELVESFIGYPKTDAWADFVAIFRKSGGPPLSRKGRLSDQHKAANIYDAGMPLGAPLRAETVAMPSMEAAARMQAKIKADQKAVADAAHRETMMASAVAAAQAQADRRERDLKKAAARIEELEIQVRQAKAAAEEQIAAIHASTSWRITAPLRRLATARRGR